MRLSRGPLRAEFEKFSKIEAVPLTTPNPTATGSPVAFSDGSAAWNGDVCHPLCHAPNWVRLWHLASFDAPSVAAVWSLAFAWAAHKRLPVWVLALQVLVVWTVYVGDRLLDARSGVGRDEEALRERHFFHWRHRRVLAPLAAGAACLAAGIVLHWMPVVTRERDSLLAVASLAYFTRVHSGAAADSSGGRIRRMPSKELLVGILFTIGCALPAWSHAHWRVLMAPVAFFAALAWLNCRAIERWESGHSDVRRAAGWLAVAGMVGAAVLGFWQVRAALFLVTGAASALLFVWLDRAKGRLTPVALRAAADLVLLTPGLLLCAAWMVWP